MDETGNEINYLGIVIGFLIFGGLMFLIAFVENKTKIKDLYYDKQSKLIEYAIMIFISLSAIIWFMKSHNIELLNKFAFIGLAIKSIMAFVVAGEADKLGRNKYLWGILAFLEFHFAMIVLGSNPKLLRANEQTKKQLEKLNLQTIEKQKNTKIAFKNEIIDYEQNYKKVAENKENYLICLESIFSDNLKIDFNTKLEFALKSGIITQKELDEKKTT